VPAPAVIPAPRAYINAVAVKGFVVELWVVGTLVLSLPYGMGPPRLLPENIRNKYHGIASFRFASNARRRTSVFITVTKKVRPKQSIDMN
jgi:hypothetical protein